MPRLTTCELNALMTLVEKQLQKKAQLEARERALEQQMCRWKQLLNENSAPCPPTPPCPPCVLCPPKPAPAPKAGANCSCCACGARPPPAQAPCSKRPRSSQARSRPVSRCSPLAADEAKLRAEIAETEMRIVCLCTNIHAMKQDYMAGFEGDDVAGTSAPPPAAPAQASPPAVETPPPPPVLPPAAAGAGTMTARKSSIVEAAKELSVAQKSLDAVEGAVKSHRSGSVVGVQDTLGKLEASIMSAHLALATVPLPDSDQASVQYKSPADLIALWNEIDITKRRLSILVTHANECKICKDKFTATFRRVDEELMELSAELKRHHNEDVAKLHQGSGAKTF